MEGRTDGRTDGAILICHPKFLRGHKKNLGNVSKLYSLIYEDGWMDGWIAILHSFNTIFVTSG